MITTGGKLWFGLTTLALVATVVYAVNSGGEWFGSFVLGTTTVAAAIIAFTAVSTRDGDVDVDDTTAEVLVRRALPAPWPALAAVSMGFVVVGLATQPVLMWLGLGLAVVTIGEWMVQGWAERATGDHAYNQALRNRIMFPFEFPILAAAIVGFVVIGFSRVLLALPKTGSWVIAAVIAAAILGVATLITSRPRISASVLTGILAIGAIAVLGGGIVGAVVGEREFHPHEEEHGTEQSVDQGTGDTGADSSQAPKEQTENSDGGDSSPDNTTEVSAP